MGVKGAGTDTQMIPKAVLRNHLRRGIRTKWELLSVLGRACPPGYGENSVLHLGQGSEKTIGINITTSQRGLHSKTASKATNGFANTLHGFWLQKCWEHSTTLCSQVHRSPFGPESQTQNMRTSSTSSPDMLSLAVTPLPGSWVKSTALLTKQITNTQRSLTWPHIN